jgi:hypothetical protein
MGAEQVPVILSPCGVHGRPGLNANPLSSARVMDLLDNKNIDMIKLIRFTIEVLR